MSVILMKCSGYAMQTLAQLYTVRKFHSDSYYLGDLFLLALPVQISVHRGPITNDCLHCPLQACSQGGGGARGRPCPWLNVNAPHTLDWLSGLYEKLSFLWAVLLASMTHF